MNWRDGWDYRAISRATIGWIVVGALLIGFTLLAIAAAGDSVWLRDVQFARWVQGREWSGLGRLTDTTNWSMSGTPLSIWAGAIVIGLFIRGRRFDARLLISALVLRIVNGWLKTLIESPRPSSDLVSVTGRAEGYGFPSGHAAGALLVAGAITWIATRQVEHRLARSAIWAIALLVIVLTGIGRIRVGVHWPSDVLGAWLWSSAALVALIALANCGRRSFPWTPGGQRAPGSAAES